MYSELYNYSTVVNKDVSIWAISYLLVDISPIIDQQLQAEGTVGGDSSQMQRGVAALVGLVDISSIVDELSSHSLLPHVTCYMECSVSKAIWLINLAEQYMYMLEYS